jgi:hypothetical protein
LTRQNPQPVALSRGKRRVSRHASAKNQHQPLFKNKKSPQHNPRFVKCTLLCLSLGAGFIGAG